MNNLKEKVAKIRTAYWEKNYGLSDYAIDTLLAYIQDLEHSACFLEEKLTKTEEELERYKREPNG